MTQTAFARLIGVSKMSVSTAIRKGRLRASVAMVDGVPQIGDPELARQEWDANTDFSKAPAATRAAASARATERAAPGEDQPLDLNAAGARAKHWDARLKELRYRAEAGELAPVADVRKTLEKVFSACKTKFLGFPSRLKQALPHLTLEDLAALEALIRELLEELAVPDDG